MSTAAAPVIRFDAFQKCFLLGSTRISGLVKLLATRFYPSYSFTRAIYNAPAVEQTEYRKRLNRRQDRTRETGVNIGITLDKQITTTVHVLRRIPDVPLRIFWDPAFMRSASIPEWAKTDCSNLLPQTRAFWKAIQQLKLRPVETQVVVGKKHKGRTIATAVDVVCIDQLGANVLIEVKCGFTGYYKNCTDKHMRAPLGKLTDSLANQHQLQLAATQEMYADTFPDRTLGNPIILHIERSKVSMYKLKDEVKAVTNWVELLLTRVGRAKAIIAPRPAATAA